MPAPKPKHEHRVVIPVTCSKEQKAAINETLSHVPSQARSEYILKLIERAIATYYIDYVTESYTHGSTTEWQISCQPDERDIIYDYCKKYLPARKRSRWIVSVILDLNLPTGR